MKIKSNKLIAGGLMTVVACALVGSITGTFAWIQYSNKSVISIHGRSIGVSENLQVKINGSDEWKSNLTWNDIAAQIGGTLDPTIPNNTTTYLPLNLAPLSNGGNDGSSNLGAKWYGNPKDTKDLPEVAAADLSGKLIQFTFRVRYAEFNGGQSPSYPAAYVYLTDIGANATANSAKISNALRVHIDFGEKQCVFNPFVPNGQANLELKATLTGATYDWDADPTSADKVYQLPQTRYTQESAATENASRQLNSTDPLTATQATAFNDLVNPATAKAEGDTLSSEEAAQYNGLLTPVQEGEYDHNPDKLTALPHSTILTTLNDGAILNAKENYKGTTIANSENGIEVTVTAWLEGFAKDIEDADHSNWWDVSQAVGKDLQFGFHLTGFKVPSNG